MYSSNLWAIIQCNTNKRITGHCKVKGAKKDTLNVKWAFRNDFFCTNLLPSLTVDETILKTDQYLAKLLATL